MEAEFGRLDVLVNNAAINYDTGGRAVFADLDEVRRTLETNLFGAWRTAQAFLPLLRRSAHPRLVNVSSESGSLERMSGGTPAYGVSKAALNVLTRKLADELRAERIASGTHPIHCFSSGAGAGRTGQCPCPRSARHWARPCWPPA
ncbi:SDR family NAD(P)-dependent oxidoreductase [Streptomyces sp. NPDC097727]|uniref:SDR family NAD(P)-dependent oxidoreductase n=1 Tax=Streptomyces sp. NPDC097727 TaxID=3366092 RepID=UPI00382BC630